MEVIGNFANSSSGAVGWAEARLEGLAGDWEARDWQWHVETTFGHSLTQKGGPRNGVGVGGTRGRGKGFSEVQVVYVCADAKQWSGGDGSRALGWVA